jgi:hypothetical protein
MAATARQKEQAAQNYKNDLAALSLGGMNTQAPQGQRFLWVELLFVSKGQYRC